MFSIEIDIDDSWITSVYEHVHHGRCFYAFEQGRVALLERIGFPIQALLDQGKALVITAVSANYKREVKRGRVTVTCEQPSLEGRSIVLHQRLLNERGKVAVEARIESAFMDLATRRGMAPPEDFVRAFLEWSKG